MGLLEGLKRLVRGDKQSKKTLFSEGKGKKKNAAKPKAVVARLPTKYFTGNQKAVSAAQTYGLVKLTVEEAELDHAKKGKEYFAVVAVGSQTLSTKSKTVKPSPAAGDSSVSATGSPTPADSPSPPGSPERSSASASTAPVAAENSFTEAGGKGRKGTVVWGASSNFVLQKGAATVAQVSVYQEGRLDGALNNYLLGWCNLDLASYFAPDQDTGVLVEGWVDLVAPEDASKVLGRIRISGEASTLHDLEREMWLRLLPIADSNGDGTLEEKEFTNLLQAFGCELSDQEISEMFRAADKDGSNSVSGDELAEMLSSYHQAGDFYKLIKRCPIDGAELTPGDDFANLIYIHLAMDEGTGESLKGGYTTESQASRAWMLRMSEWVTGSKYKAGGLRTGGSAAHILVYNRATKRVEEELIDPVLVLAMRNMYQSTVGKLMLNSGLFNKLKGLSESKGKYMDSPESVKEIEPFLQVFRGQINIDEIAEPISSFKNFNQFFYRKLKPDARPIASPDQPDVLASAADCRLMVFHTVDEATRCWIKGKQFSLAGLLADTQPGFPLASSYSGGSMAIFRLAPQDYHRFHAPCEGTIESIKDVPGQLYTVNPIAVNSRFANVFTDNKRSILTLNSPTFGPVAYIAVGATMVGSIVWTAKVGQTVAKGDELGYFAFGGSTVITLFPADRVCWDEDLVQNSLKSLETKVLMGEHLGVRKGSELEPADEQRQAQAQDVNAHTQGVVPLDERPDMALQPEESSASLSAAAGPKAA